MSESAATRLDSSLDAIAATAWTLEPPRPHEMKAILRGEAAELLDGLLVRVAHGRGALDVAIGEALAGMGIGDRVLRLGYSCLGDYARERLGIAGSTAEKMARLARELRERPLLREAVCTGEVSARKAETVVPVARGDAEAHWVARARTDTVRALRSAVKTALGQEPEHDERWERLSVSFTPEGRGRLDEAMALAGKVLGATAPKWQRLEAMCAEYLGAHPVEPRDEEARGAARVEKWLEQAKEWLEHETGKWEFLQKVAAVPAPDDARLDAGADAWRLDEDLRRLSRMRDRWDEIFGHLAQLVRQCGLWREMQFASFGHYCSERLGMAERTVAQRASLERSLYALPSLRQAMRDGRLSYEKARLVSSCADDTTVDAWIERAQRMPCIALRREIEAKEEKQMCARGELDLRVPEGVGSLVDDAFRAAREAAGEWLSPGACLERIASHFIDTWKPLLSERKTVQKKVMARDRGFCQVPGCSRPAAHAHHVLFRSKGGDDTGENLVSLCAAHHLHGVHAGYIRVRGRAPDGLTWELGCRPGAPPLVTYAARA